MDSLPSLQAVASAALAVGALFLLRYTLVVRRLRRASGERPSLAFDVHVGVFRRGRYGPDHEPERRYAARQLGLGLACALVGLTLYAWLFAATLFV